jgi:hypothetical protein
VERVHVPALEAEDFAAAELADARKRYRDPHFRRHGGSESGNLAVREHWPLG